MHNGCLLAEQAALDTDSPSADRATRRFPTTERKLLSRSCLLYKIYSNLTKCHKNCGLGVGSSHFFDVQRHPFFVSFNITLWSKPQVGACQSVCLHLFRHQFSDNIFSAEWSCSLKSSDANSIGAVTTFTTLPPLNLLVSSDSVLLSMYTVKKTIKTKSTIHAATVFV
jgi:hypothetical protein